MWGRVVLSIKLRSMCLAQGHNAVTLMKLEPVAPPSRVKLSTTEPLRSPDSAVTCTTRRTGPAKCPRGAGAYIVYKESKPAPGPEVITSQSAQLN